MIYCRLETLLVYVVIFGDFRPFIGHIDQSIEFSFRPEV